MVGWWSQWWEVAEFSKRYIYETENCRRYKNSSRNVHGTKVDWGYYDCNIRFQFPKSDLGQCTVRWPYIAASWLQNWNQCTYKLRVVQNVPYQYILFPTQKRIPGLLLKPSITRQLVHSPILPPPPAPALFTFTLCNSVLIPSSLPVNQICLSLLCFNFSLFHHDICRLLPPIPRWPQHTSYSLLRSNSNSP